MNRVFISALLLTMGIANALELSKVVVDLKTYDDHVAQLTAEFEKSPPNPEDKEWVTAKLSHMVEVDQYMRKYTSIPFEHAYTDAEKLEFNKQFTTRFSAVDSKNTTDLKSLLEIYPWFTISEFGTQADKNAWLLVQHADADSAFQVHVLSILESLQLKGETNPSNYAYLVDRVAINFSDFGKRKLQRYGTQGRCLEPGKWEPFPVEDPDHLDDRRKEVGLSTEAEYIRMFKEICH